MPPYDLGDLNPSGTPVGRRDPTPPLQASIPRRTPSVHTAVHSFPSPKNNGRSSGRCFYCAADRGRFSVLSGQKTVPSLPNLRVPLGSPSGGAVAVGGD